MPSWFTVRAARVWALLVAATVLSWTLGTESGGTAASVLVLVVAMLKVRMVGLHFMELRDAPRLVRGVFELYTLVLLAVMIGLFLAS